MEAVIEAKGLVKQYDNRTVLEGLSFVINKGECFGLLGPKGSGKSTVMKLLYGSSFITSGELFVLGLNAKKHSREIKSKIGIVPQENFLDPIFSILDNLIVHAGFYGIPSKEAEFRAIELLRQMNLEDFKDKHINILDDGMRRRLIIARALINSPDVLFLDEPTVSLDSASKVWVWNQVKKMKKEFKSLVLTTNDMEEAAQLCDRVAIIDNGRLLRVGTPEQLVKENVGKEIVEFKANEHDLNYFIKRLTEAKYSYQIVRDTVIVHIQENQDGRQVLNLISSPHITLRKPTLEDVFLKVSGHELGRAGL